MRLTFLFIFLLICNHNNCFCQTTHSRHLRKAGFFSKTELKTIDTISSLREIKMREKYMSEKTKGQRHLQMVIWEKPPKTIPYYWIKVMESNGVAYHDHFDLYVYPKTFTIKYYDIANDIAMSLSQCRKQFINEKGSAIYL